MPKLKIRFTDIRSHKEWFSTDVPANVERGLMLRQLYDDEQVEWCRERGLSEWTRPLVDLVRVYENGVCELVG